MEAADATKENKTNGEKQGIWDKIQTELREYGIDLEACCEEVEPFRAKVVCVATDLKESLRELGQSARNTVVMVRVDDETSDALDAWVETGAVKSRSEAAALFIQEGLRVRTQELDRLGDALKDVQEARQRLKQRVREVFSPDEDEV